MPTVKDINISANEITEYNIAPSSVTNTRNDQSSIVKLNDGTLVCGFSRFGDTPTDTSQSEVYISKSTDNGITWSTGEVLIPQVSEGCYAPSFYKKSNGNVLVLFFVRESGTLDSTIRSVEYNSDLSVVISPIDVILSGEYMPIGSDRIFYDEKNDKLLYPYCILTNGPGSSAISEYKGKMIYSNDEGLTWIDANIEITGKLSVDGFGGFVENGLFKNYEKITMYARNLVGAMYTSDITWNGSNYIATSIYSLGILAQNAMSSIKFDKESNLFIASYIKLEDVSHGARKEIVVATSSDALNWVEVLSVIKADGILKTNEPNIFINNEDVIITYSIQPENARYDLRCKRYKKSFFSAPIQKNRVFATNPINEERNTLGLAEFKFSEYTKNTYGNSTQTHLEIYGEIVQDQPIPKRTFYNDVQYLLVEGKTTDAKIVLGDLVNTGFQQFFRDVNIGTFSHIFASLSESSIINSLVQEFYYIKGNFENAPTTVDKVYGIAISGSDVLNYLEGSLAISKKQCDPGYKLDVLGKIKSSDIIQSGGGNSTEWDQAFSWGNFRDFGLGSSKTGTNKFSDLPNNTGFTTVLTSIEGPAITESFHVITLRHSAITSSASRIFISANTGALYSQMREGQPYRRCWSDADFDINDYVKVGYTAPSSPTATGVKGEIRMTSDYTYTCIATNTWKRTATDTTWV